MKSSLEPLKLNDERASIAVDLGAESCRVSLLRWKSGRPAIELVHRFPNNPREIDGGLRWDLDCIVTGVDRGLRKCAELAPEGIRSIAVDGWAVDYVRVAASGKPLADPFCYRDTRTIEAEKSLHSRIAPQRLREITGTQLMRINSLYQFHADSLAGLSSGERWLNLPEYVLFRLGGEPVAEYTNASHTQLLELDGHRWSQEIADAAQLDLSRSPRIVPPGTILGKLSGSLAELPGLSDTSLIAPACHDTASAIAGIPASGDDWAYISSGTWSLVGTLLEHPCNGGSAAAENFTNLGAVGDRLCFHRNVNGMWLIRQCIEHWKVKGKTWLVPDLVEAAERLPSPSCLLEVDDADLMLPEQMPQRINAQMERRGESPLDEDARNAPAFASLIFHSLAHRYAQVLDRVSFHSGKRFKRLFIVGGASQNHFLNRLTQQATGIQVLRGSPESSTLGNLAGQLAMLDDSRDSVCGVSAEALSRWATLLGEC